MICDDAAEYVSALCDGETIPPGAAEHIGTCPGCQARLRDYLALGVELRRTASLELSSPVAPRVWTKPHNLFATWWQRGWETMKIPRLAFAVLIVGILALTSALTVNKVRAHDTGTVVLLSTVGPNGPLMDCPLSTLDRNQATCSYIGQLNGKVIGYKIDLLNHETNRVELAIRTKVFEKASGGYSFSGIEAEPQRRVWLEPGEPLKMDIPDLGTLTLTGEWMDHMPIFIGFEKQDFSPGPNEVRFASPLLLKDKKLAGDLVGAVSGVFSTDSLDYAVTIYIPTQGRFLISQSPIQGAVEAKVALSRLTFEEGGHSWELVNGVPITRHDHLWVLHQPDFKRNATGENGDHIGFGNTKLVQTAPGVWVAQ